MPILQTLMTRAYREKLNAPKQDANSMASATIRIRLPEGLVLQGEFDAGAYLHLLLTSHRVNLSTAVGNMQSLMLLLTPAYEADLAEIRGLDRLLLARSTRMMH